MQQQQPGRGGEKGDVEQLAAIDEPAQQQGEQPEEEEEQQQQGDEEGQEQGEQQQGAEEEEQTEVEEEEKDAGGQQQDEGGEEEGAEEQRGRDVSKSWPPGPSPYHQALASCRDLACLTAAGKLERYPGQFRFPHFFIVGWQVGGCREGGSAAQEGGRTGGGLVLQALLGSACRPPLLASCCR